VPFRRLEDRIVELCNQLIATDEDSSEFNQISTELRAAIAEHIERARTKLSDFPPAFDRRGR